MEDIFENIDNLPFEKCWKAYLVFHECEIKYVLSMLLNLKYFLIILCANVSNTWFNQALLNYCFLLDVGCKYNCSASTCFTPGNDIY